MAATIGRSPRSSLIRSWLLDLFGQRSSMSVVLGVLVVILGLGFQGDRSLWESDEGRYVNIAQQMLASGDWLTPRLDDEHTHFAKPPFTYWLIGASLAIFGRNEWAARLPYALAFIVTAWMVLRLAQLLMLDRPRLAALVWSASPAPFLGFSIVTTDAILTTLETAAMLALVRSGIVARDSRPDPRFISWAWLAFGLAFMTKGPPGLLPVLACCTWLVLDRRWSVLPVLFRPRALLLFALAGLSWYAVVVAREPALLKYFLQFEFIDRVFSDVHGRNPSLLSALWLYPVTLLVGSLPWLALVPRRKFVSTPTTDRRSRTFLWCWLLVPLAVFTMARSRLPLYVLPLFVPLALLLSQRVALRCERSPFAVAGVCVAMAVILLVIRFEASFLEPAEDDRALSRSVRLLETKLAAAPQEIIFVETKPSYGLRFYLGSQIESVRLEATASALTGPDLPETVCSEAGDQHPALWLVPPGMSESFRQQGQRCGARFRHVGTIGTRYAAFEMRPPTG